MPNGLRSPLFHSQLYLRMACPGPRKRGWPAGVALQPVCPKGGSGFPQQTLAAWSYYHETSATELPWYCPGIALSLTPIINDFTFESCMPMDEGSSCTSLLTSVRDRWSGCHYSKCAVVDPSTQRGEKNCPGDEARISELVSEPRCSDWPGLWGPG